MIYLNNMEIIGTTKISYNAISFFRTMQFILIVSSLCLVPPFTLYAQQNVKVTIKGKIVNKETGLPLEYVNVFLANTTIGTATGKDGEFIINNAPTGVYDLIFSYVGFGTQKKHIRIFENETLDYNISLSTKPINYSQVDIIGKSPSEWEDNMDIFKDIFIGESNNSDETKILNPEVISFKENKSSNLLKAYSDSVLKIENKSLGYMIYVVLDSLIYNKFDKSIKYVDYAKFQELVPASEDDSVEWNENRHETYMNSPRYFFFQLVHKKLYKKEFKLYTGTISELLNMEGDPIDGQDLDVTTNRDSTVYELNFTGCLKVKRNSKTSILSFYNPVTELDKYGNFLKSFYTVEIYGYWSNQGIADALPLNYIFIED